MENYGLVTTKIVQKSYHQKYQYNLLKKNWVKMDENDSFQI